MFLLLGSLLFLLLFVLFVFDGVLATVAVIVNCVWAAIRTCIVFLNSTVDWNALRSVAIDFLTVTEGAWYLCLHCNLTSILINVIEGGRGATLKTLTASALSRLVYNLLSGFVIFLFNCYASLLIDMIDVPFLGVLESTVAHLDEVIELELLFTACFITLELFGGLYISV